MNFLDPRLFPSRVTIRRASPITTLGSTEESWSVAARDVPCCLVSAPEQVEQQDHAQGTMGGTLAVFRTRPDLAPGDQILGQGDDDGRTLTVRRLRPRKTLDTTRWVAECTEAQG